MFWPSIAFLIQRHSSIGLKIPEISCVQRTRWVVFVVFRKSICLNSFCVDIRSGRVGSAKLMRISPSLPVIVLWMSSMRSFNAEEPRRMLVVSDFLETPCMPINSISALSKAMRMARRDSVLMSEWPFSKLLIAVFESPDASARSCCVQASIPRAPRHCSIVSIVTQFPIFFHYGIGGR